MHIPCSSASFALVDILGVSFLTLCPAGQLLPLFLIFWHAKIVVSIDKVPWQWSGPHPFMVEELPWR